MKSADDTTKERCKKLRKAWKTRHEIMSLLLDDVPDQPNSEVAYYAAVAYGFALNSAMLRIGCPDKKP